LGTTYHVGEIRGFINADIEYLDYTNANYNGTAYSSSKEEQKWTKEVNKQISAKLGSGANIRLGTELAFKNLRLRAGLGWDRTAFNSDDFYNTKTSFGIGFREDNFFIDFGFRAAQYAEGYNPYVTLNPSLDPLARFNTGRSTGALTLGFKF
jgi:long-subunit fatty acid transport protein